MSNFQDAAVEYGGRTVTLAVEECEQLVGGASIWHGPGDPSSWLSVAVFLLAREKLGDAPDSVTLELAAASLGVTTEMLYRTIRWNEEYMRWHDGDWEYQILQTHE